MEKQKYVRLKEHGSIIIFPCVIEHSKFKKFDIESAGFCYINTEKQRITCFGESHSLNLKSNEKEDSINATMQVFGVQAVINII